MTNKHLKRRRQVLGHVPPVSDLECLGSASGKCSFVALCAVTGDDFNLWMLVNQVVIASGVCSGRRSTGWWRSRSTRIEPYRCPFRTAHSSIPTTRGDGGLGSEAACTCRRIVSALPLIPRAPPRRAPAFPPSMRPNIRSASLSAIVRYADRCVIPGTCSAKVTWE
jgi:hypothetical protein